MLALTGKLPGRGQNVQLMATVLLLFFSLTVVTSVNLVELDDSTIEMATKTNSDHHVVILWRDSRNDHNNEVLNAFSQAAQSFQGTSANWAVIDVGRHQALRGKFQVGRIPTVQFFAAGQTQTQGSLLPVSYSNPNIIAGVVIDSGFIAQQILGAIHNAEVEAADLACRDENSDCPQWAIHGECVNNRDFMITKCKRSCFDAGVDEACRGVKSRRKPKCFDEAGFQACREWAAQGQCPQNPEFMHIKCMFSCKRCDMTEEDKRLIADAALKGQPFT